MTRLYLLVFCFCSSIAWGQRDWQEVATKQAIASTRDLYDLLSIPNDAHRPDDIEKNIAWCESAFAKRGFSTKRLSTPTIPLLMAERKFPNAKRTVLIYLQIDGQPVNASQWDQASPWTPTLKELGPDQKWHTLPFEKVFNNPNPDWRIFARSTSDAKGPAMAFLAALDAGHELRAMPNYNIKVIMDFEEELGSPRLPEAVTRYKADLAADMLVIYDGPRHISNRPTLTFGARGICEVSITVYGPRVPVHSGNYGNYTPNPAMRLSQLLATMKDDDGRVLLPGFYDGIKLTEQEKQILKQVPDNDEEIRKFLGIAAPDRIGDNFQESLQYPTLNIRGLDALFIGQESRTLIPASATAEIDIRLVPGSDPERLMGLVRKHLEAHGYYVTDRAPSEDERMTHPRIAEFHGTTLYGAFQTPFDSECGAWLSRAMVKTFGQQPIRIRTAGGSIPISPFVVTLGIPAVAVPTVNPDNNQHAENENIRVGNYIDAVKTFTAILMEKL